MRDFVKEHFSNIRAPFTAGIELTAKCNFNCIHCYARPGRAHDDLSLQEIKSIIDTLVERGLLELFFTGGEVFTRQDFEDIYIYAKEKGLIVSVLSNISLLNERHIELFKEYPVAQISTTMYGASNETYKAVTGIEGAYDKFLDSIEMLKSNGIPFEIKFIAMRQNIKDIYRIRAFGKSLNVNMVMGFDIRPMINYDQSPIALRVLPEEAFEFDKKDEGRRNFWINVAKEEMKNGENSSARFQIRRLSHFLYPCAIAYQFVFITSDGKMQGCTKATYDQYDLRKGNFDEGWEYLKKRFVMQKASDSFKCSSCEKMKYCEQCTANFMLEYNNPEEVDPFFCEIADLRKRFVIELKEVFSGKKC